MTAKANRTEALNAIESLDAMLEKKGYHFYNFNRKWERNYFREGESEDDSLSVTLTAVGNNPGFIRVHGSYGVACTCNVDTLKVAVGIVLKGVEKMDKAYKK